MSSVIVCNNTSFPVQKTLLNSCDQKRQETCEEKNVPDAEAVQGCLVCQHQPLGKMMRRIVGLVLGQLHHNLK